MEKKKIAWAITGAGHALEECVGTIMEQNEVDLFLSLAAEEVLKMYGLYSRLQDSGLPVFRDDGASAPVAAFSATKDRSCACIYMTLPTTSGLNE